MPRRITWYRCCGDASRCLWRNRWRRCNRHGCTGRYECRGNLYQRHGEHTYEDLKNLSDIELAVNCTPVGMYPNCPDSPCDLDVLPDLEAVVDIVYNPARTGIILEAEKRGIPCTSGLLMLVAQAAQAVERYTGRAIELSRTYEVSERLATTEQISQLSVCQDAARHAAARP